MLIGFLALSAATLALPSTRRALFLRRKQDWWIDGSSLVVHFLVVPAVQVWVSSALFGAVLPSWKGSLELPAVAAFLGNLLVIDYAWYWNHRLFHAPTPLWNLHATHHSATHLDVFATPRNAIWSPLFMVYLWMNGLGVFLLKDPSWFIAGALAGALTNLWGHTTFGPRPGTWMYKILSVALITPHDHYWHHSSDNHNCNFATVFNFWDKLHGTWYAPKDAPASLGYPNRDSAVGELFLIG